MTQLLDNLDFYVLPVLNIDGYVYTWTKVLTLIFVPFTVLRSFDLINTFKSYLGLLSGREETDPNKYVK